MSPRLGRTAALTEEAPGRGRKPRLAAEKVNRIVEATLQTTPPNATHWSVRTMAKAQAVSPATVQRIWDAHGLQPHRVRTFKLSNDKRFVEKLTDVVGLYLNPPDKALVLCVDEKSRIQALDRNTFIGPGYANTDFSIMKNTKIPWPVGQEGANLQFRCEFFNVFNRVNLAGVVSDLSNPQFGKSTSTYPSRDIQFALRLSF